MIRRSSCCPAAPGCARRIRCPWTTAVTHRCWCGRNISTSGSRHRACRPIHSPWRSTSVLNMGSSLLIIGQHRGRDLRIRSALSARNAVDEGTLLPCGGSPPTRGQFPPPPQRSKRPDGLGALDRRRARWSGGVRSPTSGSGLPPRRQPHSAGRRSRGRTDAIRSVLCSDPLSFRLRTVDRDRSWPARLGGLVLQSSPDGGHAVSADPIRRLERPSSAAGSRRNFMAVLRDCL